jgi:hypothetical protein
MPNLKSVGGILGNRDRRPCSFVAALKWLSLPQGQSASSLACLLPHPRALVLGMCIAGYPKSTGQTGTSLSTLSSSVTSLLKLLHFQPHTLLVLPLVRGCWVCTLYSISDAVHGSSVFLSLRHSAPNDLAKLERDFTCLASLASLPAKQCFRVSLAPEAAHFCS